MKDKFCKFPSTPHLILLDDIDIRSDKVMSEAERDDFLQHEIIVEEKIDGANLGISFDTSGAIKCQNRGHYLHPPYSVQWKTLSAWLTPRIDTFFDVLTDQYILFGEWCYAQHSVFYQHLPDWFLGFEILDKAAGKFLAVSKRDALFRELKISQVPMLTCGKFSLLMLKSLLSPSQFGSSPAEGLYLRFDKGAWLQRRSKIVRAAFIQAVEQHWSRSELKINQRVKGNRQAIY